MLRTPEHMRNTSATGRHAANSEGVLVSRLNGNSWKYGKPMQSFKCHNGLKRNFVVVGKIAIFFKKINCFVIFQKWLKI